MGLLRCIREAPKAVACATGREQIEVLESVLGRPAECDAVLPAIEVVETRLLDWHGSEPLARLADLQSHGALVHGDLRDIGPVSLGF